ncbi:MAG: leucine-rich repeat protein, partial [Prevotella sp.]|nr:leucine-rich repeat protein [Prevotella sp.]
IPNSVTSIGTSAFSGCSGLTSVTIPSSVTSIGSSAFNGCSGLQKVIVPNIDIKKWCNIKFASSTDNPLSFAHHLYSDENTEITKLVIPDGVTSISSYAFSGCSGLTSVTIPNSVTRIGSSAFSGCSGLTSVTIPNSVTSIGEYAFYGCSGLTSVTIPNSVTSIGAEAFYNTRIKSLTIGTGIQTIASDAFSYSSYYGAKPVKVIWLANTQPSGYKNAGGTINYVPNDSYNGLSGQKIYPFLSSMFEVDGIKYVPVSPSERTCDAIDCVYNKSAENTKIGNTITYKNITMTVKNVGDYICSGNTFIKELDYSYNGGILSTIFSGCSNITSITIGSGVKRMIESAFSDCKNITSVTWNAKNCSYSCSSSNPHSPFYNSKTNIIDFIIGEDVVAIPAYMCYEMSNLKSINIPDSVTSIGDRAFSGCSGLTSVTIGNSVTSISDRAFSGCSGLTSVTIPNSVTSIGSSAFYNCSGLQKVIVPDIKNWCSIKFGNLTANPLYYAHHLYSDKNTEITELVIPDDVTNISFSAFSGCSGLTSVTIPNSVTSIGEDAFSGCSGLTSVTIGNSVTSISDRAFSGCSGLISVTIGNSVTSISDRAFSGCSGLTSVTIPNSVTSIGDYAFEDCSGLTSVTIGNSVTSIGSSAFSGCSGLTSVRFENSKDNTPIVLENNKVFSDCPLDEVYIGRKLSYTTTSSAGYSPFYKKTTLRSVKFTDKETEISDYEFYGCTNLTDVSMGDGVKSIGAYAFSGCSSLEHFTCGRQLESIGKEAFSDCTSMTKFKTRAAVPPTCGAQALDDINKWECTLYVPTESIDDYQAADQWKNFFFIEKFNLQGDSNGDDVVNAKDYSGVASYIMGYSPEEFDAETSDVDENGTVDVRDYVGIANIISTGSIYGGTSNNAKAAMSKGMAMPMTDESDAENVIYVENVSGSKNSQVELSVRMRNASDIRGFQFDLYLPEGVTMANNAKASLSSDRLAAGDAHMLMVNEMTDGAVRFLCSSMNDESFAGGDGEIATLTVNIADNVANGDYDVVVKNAIMTETDISRSYEADNIKSTLTVLDQTGVETVTEDNERRDGSIYTVGGQLVGKKATTNQLRKGIYIRNGKKFVVK